MIEGEQEETFKIIKNLVKAIRDSVQLVPFSQTNFLANSERLLRSHGAIAQPINMTQINIASRLSCGYIPDDAAQTVRGLFGD